jgi:hypothetical protein
LSELLSARKKEWGTTPLFPSWFRRGLGGGQAIGAASCRGGSRIAPTKICAIVAQFRPVRADRMWPTAAEAVKKWLPSPQRRRDAEKGPFVLKPLRLGDSTVRRVFGDYFTASAAVGKWQLLTLQPASAGDRVAYRGRLFLSPLPGLVSCSAAFPHGFRQGPHSAAATRLASARFFPLGVRCPADEKARI